MTELKIDRRQLLRMGLSSGVLAAIPLGCVVLRDDDTGALLQFVSDSRLPADETRTGSLSQADFDTLAGLCEYINRAWELTPDLSAYLERLQSDLEFKTKYEPSYLTEYQHAVELIDVLVANSEGVEQAWSSLLFAQFEAELAADLEAERFAHSKLGRARTFVFSEIITHQVSLSGGFKSFGLVNYRGYFGGSFAEVGSYRRGDA